jgi:hypothetical protein
MVEANLRLVISIATDSCTAPNSIAIRSPRRRA